MVRRERKCKRRKTRKNKAGKGDEQNRNKDNTVGAEAERIVDSECNYSDVMVE